MTKACCFFQLNHLALYENKKAPANNGGAFLTFVKKAYASSLPSASGAETSATASTAGAASTLRT